MTGRLAILADDLTGAADTGAAFAAAGRCTVVLLSPEAPIPPSADVLVMTSESRALAPDEATDATRRCARRIATWCGGDESARVYTKIDSTLRGHPSLVLRAVMDALGATRALVAPAFPAQGRTTSHGHQYVGGVPIEDTSFGREVPISDLAALFAAHACGHVALLPRDDLHRGADHVALLLAQDRRVWIADAEDDGDLALLAAAALASSLRVLCGSAGLARAIADARRQRLGTGRWHDHEGRGPDDDGRGPDDDGRLLVDEGRRPVLVVAGSRHAATAAQVDALARRGTLVVHPEVSYLEGRAHVGAVQTVVHVADALASGTSVVLSTAGLPEVSAARPGVAARLASIVAGVCDRVHVEGLVLTGGDTAAAVCEALGAKSLWLTGELQPGIATATLIGGRHPDLAVVTKAGGFGGDAALCQAVSFLRARGR